MKPSLVLMSLVSGSFASILQPRGCDADDCARAVTGTRFVSSAQASHMADCSSFMIESVISDGAPVSTMTITFTVFATPSAQEQEQKRTAAPSIPGTGNPASAIFASALATITPRAAVVEARTSIPAGAYTVVPSLVPSYASACSGTARYFSACSCAGITRTITSLATITSTVSTTITSTICDPANNYGMTYDNGNIDSNMQNFVTYINDVSAADCCAACFSGAYPGCWGYEYLSPLCLIGYETGGPNTPTEFCPYGIYHFTDFSYSSNAALGLGPCAEPYLTKP